MKTKLKYIMLSIFAILAIAIYIIYRCTFYYPDIIIKVNGLYNQPPEIYCLDNEYYRNYKGNIYNLETNESIYNTANEEVIAREFDNLLWIYDDEADYNLMAVDSAGEVVKSFSIPKEIREFTISNNAVLCSVNGEIRIFKLLDNSNTEEIFVEYSYVDELEYGYCKFYKCKSEYGTFLKFDMNSQNDDDFFCAIDTENKYIIMTDGYFNFMEYNDKQMFLEIENYMTEIVIEYSFENNIESIYEAGLHCGFFPNRPFYADSEKNISIGQITTLRSIGREGPVDISDEMEKHLNDILLVYDTNNFSQYSERRTKTFERIIYADSEKAITYYNGKYITYDIQSWEKLDKQRANEIKKGGSYIFETCGDYIFVLDLVSGEILNRIEVGS